ncbi:uncharacterized protein PITG_22468 [Phytophthora infestans T30-4]|uniref:Uncharacterized protein n=1 Tax=Phytophthora infestans (strain T30-4) TaxID=403677 RepID=D0RMD2_PHYIT|nr:uncharacterized protein PITG_22468 [Phytophthora infestans T30-4]EEY62339.1 conserved hypothetical protein [Phytophthora infestans T30-4]|eukprot:XP_002909798.1 conserved hypothetical protein [Phytophthora infestans T30-4]
MESINSSMSVFDGTTDFRVWKSRLENELMRYHLLGYVMVRGYDGSQSFTYNGEEVPPRTPIIHVDDEQHQSLIKEETAPRPRGSCNATCTQICFVHCTTTAAAPGAP